MHLSQKLLKYLLKEAAGLPSLISLGKKGAGLFKNLDALGNEAKVLKLKTLLNSMDDITGVPKQAAKLARIAEEEKVGSIRDLIRNASRATTAEEAGKVADDLERILKKAETGTAKPAAPEVKPAAPEVSAGKVKPEDPDIAAASKSKASGKKQYFDNPESQKLLDRIQGLKASGATDEEIKPFRDQLLRLEGADPKDVDDISKRLQKLQSDYEIAIKTGGGEDSPRAKAIKNEMEKLNGVTTFTKIRRFCGKDFKRGGLCLAVLGTAGFAAYKVVDSLIKPVPSPKPTPGPTPGPSPGPVSRKCKGTLKRGCKGDNVKEMQQKLINCGYSLPKKGADGVFGSETKSAVASFQKDNNLKVDGVAGKETLKALESCKAKNRDVEEKPSKEETPVPKQQEPEISPKGKTEEPSTTGFLEKTFQDIDKLKKARATDDLTSRETAQRQYEKDDEKFKKFQADLGESKLKRTLNIIKNRNDSIENIVFERLVKGCK